MKKLFISMSIALLLSACASKNQTANSVAGDMLDTATIRSLMVLDSLAQKNKVTCQGLALAECAKKYPLEYYAYDNKYITDYDADNMRKNSITNLGLYSLQQVQKNASADGTITVSGKTLKLPDFSYIPTAGFLNTPLEAQMKATFPSGVYEVPKNMLKKVQENQSPSSSSRLGMNASMVKTVDNILNMLNYITDYNKQVCKDMLLKECAQKQPLLYVNYANKFGKPYNASDRQWDVGMLILFSVSRDIQYKIKKDGYLNLEGVTAMVPDFNYIPTSGLLNTPLEAQMKSAFPSGVYEVPENMKEATKQLHKKFGR